MMLVQPLLRVHDSTKTNGLHHHWIIYVLTIRQQSNKKNIMNKEKEKDHNYKDFEFPNLKTKSYGINTNPNNTFKAECDPKYRSS